MLFPIHTKPATAEIAPTCWGQKTGIEVLLLPLELAFGLRLCRSLLGVLLSRLFPPNSVHWYFYSHTHAYTKKPSSTPPPQVRPAYIVKKSTRQRWREVFWEGVIGRRERWVVPKSSWQHWNMLLPRVEFRVRWCASECMHLAGEVMPPLHNVESHVCRGR